MNLPAAPTFNYGRDILEKRHENAQENDREACGERSAGEEPKFSSHGCTPRQQSDMISQLGDERTASVPLSREV